MAVLRLSATLCAIEAFAAGAAQATVVAVSVNTKAGAALEDTIVVLDALDAQPAPDHAAAVIDQINKRFVPRMNVIRTGTSVTFPNSDRIRHQVYSFSRPKPFTLKLYSGSPTVAEVFDKPGLVILGCNIHDTMVAFVGVVDSPYFAKVPASGTVQLNVPPGRYRLRVWYPTMTTDSVPRQIAVAGEPMAIPLVVDVDPARDGIATWPE